jgi:integrase/recombinase XerD
MNLHELIERYITYRQTLWEKFKTNASILRAFGRAIGVSATITDVCREKVEAFLAGVGPLTSAWHIRYYALLGFYHYALNRGHVACSPLPLVLPQRPPPFIPYIYEHDEIRRLLRATDCYLKRQSRVEPITLRTIVLLMYGSGLRVHEVVSLNQEDIDLGNALVTVRHTKFVSARPSQPCQAGYSPELVSPPLTKEPGHGTFTRSSSGTLLAASSPTPAFQRSIHCRVLHA